MGLDLLVCLYSICARFRIQLVFNSGCLLCDLLSPCDSVLAESVIQFVDVCGTDGGNQEADDVLFESGYS